MSAIAKTVKSMNPLLLPDRDKPYWLHVVYEKVIDGCRDEIVLNFGDSYLSFRAEPDTDEIVGQFHGKKFARRSYRSIGHEAPWSRYLNENCGWTWLAINQQGYWDSVLISFDSVVPNILLNVMASSIYVFAVGPMRTVGNKRQTKPRMLKDKMTSDRDDLRPEYDLSRLTGGVRGKYLER